MNITVTGQDKIGIKLNKMLSTESISNCINKICAEVERDAKINCPVDTGELRNSIKYEVDGLTGYVFTNKEYAVYVHQGTGLFAMNGDGRMDVPWTYKDAEGIWWVTSGQHPNPFLVRALDNVKHSGRVEEIFKEELNR